MMSTGSGSVSTTTLSGVRFDCRLLLRGTSATMGSSTFCSEELSSLSIPRRRDRSLILINFFVSGCFFFFFVASSSSSDSSPIRAATSGRKCALRMVSLGTSRVFFWRSIGLSA